MPHEGTPDEDGVGDTSEAEDVFGSLVAALRYRHAVFRDLGEKSGRERPVDIERLEVPVIGADDRGVVTESFLDLGGSMTLEEGSQIVVGACRDELVQIRIRETAENEEDGTGSEPGGLRTCAGSTTKSFIRTGASTARTARRRSS